ncbi:MAG TPA: ATPase [Desulfovibrio sp.]|nr:ATPase [Desulfovibrio sp.]
MLKNIFLKNFKSFKEATLPLSSLTLLIGANASGKSNAIEGVRLLNWLAEGRKLMEITHSVQDSDQVMRGRISDIGYCGESKFIIGCSKSGKWNQLTIELELREDELHIIDESIEDNEEIVPLYKIKSPSKKQNTDIKVEYNNFSVGRVKPIVKCVDSRAVFTQLDSPATFGEKHKRSQKEIPETTKSYQHILGGMLFLDPVPSLMRGSEFKSEKIMRGDGRNLSGVLFNLCEYKNPKKKLLSIIKSLPEQDIKDILFYETDRGKVLLELVENFGGDEKKWEASLLSDGTLRVLAIAGALLSAPKGSLVIIEEVDNGVHPSRAKHLLEAMRELAEERDLRLLLSTHNPALMDAVPDESLGDVVFCYRDAKDGSSKLTKLSDLSDFPALAARGPLGQLATKRIVEKFAKSSVTPEEKKEKALAWINELQQAGE